ncbi:MAG: hypothetical protein ACN2B6_01245 [Rickettsiales bacterium]
MEKVHGTYRISEHLKSKISDAASAEDRSFNNMLEQIVIRYFELNVWAQYEIEKSKLSDLVLTCEEYDAEISIIKKKYGL